MEKVRLSEPRFLLHLAGMDPLQPSKLRSTLTILVYSATVALQLAELALNYTGVDSLARASESIFAQYALLWKIALLIVYKQRVAGLVQKTHFFWPLEEFGAAFTKQFASQHSFLRTFFRLYTANLFVLGTQFILIPILNKDQLPVMMYVNESSPTLHPLYKNFVYVLHALYMFFGCALVAGFDCLFFYLIGHVVSELKMVTVAFEHDASAVLGNKEGWMRFEEKFKECVEHHVFVMKFAGELNETYSVMLLNQHMCSLFGICFGIFLMTKDGIPPDVDHFTKYLTFIFSYVLQIWTYCFAGDQIINWSLKIPDAVFYDNWQDDHSFRNSSTKIIIIKRAQKPAKVTLGGFGDLNIESFNVVIQNAVNFFLFMDTMYKEK